MRSPTTSTRTRRKRPMSSSSCLALTRMAPLRSRRACPPPSARWCSVLVPVRALLHRIARRDEEAGLLVRDRLAEPTYPAGDDRSAGGYRLERRDTEPFVERRQHHDVGGRETGRDVSTEAGEADHAG